jgi:23S rRNA (pseudouridine1915-N3)-methyltransferase
MQLRILWVGKTKNASLRALMADYLARVRRFFPCEVAEVRDASKARGGSGPDMLAAEADDIARMLPAGCKTVVLDASGEEMSSTDFAGWMGSELNRGTRVIAFVIGGPSGIHARIRNGARLRISFGKMTWTHEMCRVLLLEQIYRAACILRNIPYHR